MNISNHNQVTQKMRYWAIHSLKIFLTYAMRNVVVILVINRENQIVELDTPLTIIIKPNADVLIQGELHVFEFYRPDLDQLELGDPSGCS